MRTWILVGAIGIIVGAIGILVGAIGILVGAIGILVGAIWILVGRDLDAGRWLRVGLNDNVSRLPASPALSRPAP